MRLLDLFCGAGGAAMGYHRAGFDVVGVDIEPQPRYPFEFHQADALEFLAAHGHEYDAIHASPPCQAHSVITKRWKGRSEQHPQLIAPIRTLLNAIGKPYTIENVVGARAYLRKPLMLCGTMFGLETPQGNQLQRHRLFELPWLPSSSKDLDVKHWHGLFCRHNSASAIGVHGGGQHPKRRRTIGVYGSTGGSSKRDGISFFGVEARRQVMGIDWMTGAELNQAIPPAYTEWIGERLREEVERLEKAMEGLNDV